MADAEKEAAVMARLRAMLKNAYQEYDRLKKIQVATFRVLPETAEFASTRFKIARGNQALIFSEASANPVALEGGLHEVGHIFDLAQQKGAKGKDKKFAVVCEAAKTITIPVVLPDFATIKLGDLTNIDGQQRTDDSIENLRKEDIEAAINSLALHTSDGFLGGAMMQMTLICCEPARLVEKFGRRGLHELNGGVAKGSTPGLEEDRKRGLFGKLWGLITGKTEQIAIDPALLNVTAAIQAIDIYQSIGLELQQALKTALQSVLVVNAYDDVDTREDIERRIKQSLAQSLLEYGLKIDRVTGFKFLSPSYEEVLAEADIVARREHEARLREKLAEIQAKESQIDGKLDRERLAQDELTAKQKAQIEGDLRVGRAHNDAQVKVIGAEVDRDIHHKNQKVEIDLQFERAGKAAALQQQMLNAELDRKMKMIEMLKSVSALDPEKMAMIVGAVSPHMAKALEAKMKAMSVEERLKEAQRHQAELIQHYQTMDAGKQRLLEAGVAKAVEILADKNAPQPPPTEAPRRSISIQSRPELGNNSQS